MKTAHSKDFIEQCLNLIRFPKYKQYFSKFVPMDEGRLAVVVDSSEFDSSTLDIFDRQGQFQGRVTVPVSSNGLRIKNGKLYCLRTDEEGYHFIKRYSYELK